MAFRRIFHNELYIYIYIYIYTHTHTFHSYRLLRRLVAQLRKLFFLPSGVVAKTFVYVHGKNIEPQKFVLFKIY